MPPKGKKRPEPKVSKKQKIALKKQQMEAQQIMTKYMPTILVCAGGIIFCFLAAIVMGAMGIIPTPTSRA